MLALWEFFWTGTDWSGAPAPTPAPAPAPTPVAGPSNAGGGHRKYESAPPDFWDVRERYLRRFVEPTIERVPAPIPTPPPTPETAVAPSPPQPNDILLRQALAAAAARARAAQTTAELQQAARRIANLALDISKLHQEYYDHAIAMLLLDAF